MVLAGITALMLVDMEPKVPRTYGETWRPVGAPGALGSEGILPLGDR